jgi:hypothetical protein
MNDNQVMRDQLLALLRGGHAHLTFDQAVADFPPDRINSRPPNVPYTPWHLLEHVRIAQWDILEFIRDPQHVSPEWPVYTILREILLVGDHNAYHIGEFAILRQVMGTWPADRRG